MSWHMTDKYGSTILTMMCWEEQRKHNCWMMLCKKNKLKRNKYSVHYVKNSMLILSNYPFILHTVKYLKLVKWKQGFIIMSPMVWLCKLLRSSVMCSEVSLVIRQGLIVSPHAAWKHKGLFSPSALFTGKELCLYGAENPFIIKSV